MKALFQILFSTIFVACGPGNGPTTAPQKPTPPPPCPSCEEPAPPPETVEVETPKPILEVPRTEPATVSNLGTKGIQDFYSIPECRALTQGHSAYFQFHGNYLARWTNYKATLSAVNMDLENQFLKLKFETNYFGRIGITFANDGKSSLETNYHVMPSVVCTEYPVMCLQRLDEIEETIHQIRNRSTTQLTSYQIASLNCLQNLIGLFRQAIPITEDS